MKCLVIGQRGLVARALSQLKLSEGMSVHALGQAYVDVRNKASVSRALDRLQPDVVINTAAYTRVDQAESEPELANAINWQGAESVGAATAEFGIPIVHLSTDYVFDGTKPSPYTECDEALPLNVYGRSKLAGEKSLAEANPNHITLRTSWVYAPYGTNFVRTLLNMPNKHRDMPMVVDQLGTPTYAVHLAEGIVALASMVIASPGTYPWGTYNMAGSGSTNWLGFAREIFKNAADYGVAQPNLKAATARELALPALRPQQSCLDTSKLEKTFGFTLPDWRVGARDCVKRILGKH